MVVKNGVEAGAAIVAFPNATSSSSDINDFGVAGVQFDVADAPTHQGGANLTGTQVTEQFFAPIDGVLCWQECWQQ
jgi:hypothetical protein